ncbi:MAG: DUF3127 domain-containing protein [Clostridium sp.]|nr:DUF3127 domain-containing protein [Clostridium sp.]
MEITGKIIAVLPERGGVSARTGSEWKAQEYVLETQEQYPRKMCFDVFGADKIAQFAIQIGMQVTVSFDIDAREYNGRWYNSIRAWRVQPAVAAPEAGAPVPTSTPFPPAGAAPAAPVDFSAGDSKDDLPF